MEYFLNKEFCGGIKNINTLVDKILKDVTPILNEDLIFDVRLILNELLINCHEHGNKFDDEKSIKLVFEVNDESIYFSVADQGQGITGRKIYENSECKCHGRGLILVESLVDDIKFEENKVNCFIKL
ncbi:MULTISPECIES: ATP-binding protein [Helcococcus]|uniref:ATP-binding protein n=1 Tax=Helcococcus bovis TaxID=3153252 RepID=A0ABW9F746_9FIRM